MDNLSVATWSRQNAETIGQGISEGSSVPCLWPKYLKQPDNLFISRSQSVENTPFGATLSAVETLQKPVGCQGV
ncbi:MAG: hypothetical protein C4B58_09290 [Deltaproteobacteria bacterium]|nr:MAG: hypothetical protein C4B58_09290 [Deltaproteobacteria bacterium]